MKNPIQPDCCDTSGFAPEHLNQSCFCITLDRNELGRALARGGRLRRSVSDIPGKPGHQSSSTPVSRRALNASRSRPHVREGGRDNSLTTASKSNLLVASTSLRAAFCSTSDSAPCDAAQTARAATSTGKRKRPVSTKRCTLAYIKAYPSAAKSG